MQDGVHLFRDWHFNLVSLCQTKGCICGKNAFRHHAVHAGDNLLQRLSLAQSLTDAAIS